MLTILHAAATLLMTGVVLCIAVVHYPLFAKVGKDAWTAYEAAHVVGITWVVAPLMLAEVVLAVLLLIMPAATAATNRSTLTGTVANFVTPSLLAWIGLGLLAICWGITFFFSVPQHGRLATGWDDPTHAALLWWNWVRTLAWVARSVVAVWLLAMRLP